MIFALWAANRLSASRGLATVKENLVFSLLQIPNGESDAKISNVLMITRYWIYFRSYIIFFSAGVRNFALYLKNYTTKNKSRVGWVATQPPPG
jgi:hypothetical protein